MLLIAVKGEALRLSKNCCDSEFVVIFTDMQICEERIDTYRDNGTLYAMQQLN